MKNVMKSFGIVIVASVLLWSCSKDDGPTPPKNTAPAIVAQEFSVDEDITDTDVIGVVKATDVEKDALTFSIKTNDNGLFEITTAGDLSLATGKALDFETASQHVITVQVSDGDKTVTATVTVKVTDVYEPLADDPASFVTTWKTTTDNEKIEVSINNNLSYDYHIDWGDGTIEHVTTGEKPSHTYTKAGIHIVAIKGKFPVIAMGNDDVMALKLQSIEQWGAIEWESMNNAFTLCENMVHNAADTPDLSKVTDMSYMFNGATSFNGAIGNWDTSNVTNMAGIFDGAIVFNQPLGDWDTSNVTSMASMFKDAAAFNQNLGGWELNSITSMNNMFDNSGLNTINYSNILKGWGGQGNVFIPDGITLGAIGVNFCNDEDTTYFHDTVLITQNGWTINDEGAVACQ